MLRRPLSDAAGWAEQGRHTARSVGASGACVPLYIPCKHRETAAFYRSIAAPRPADTPQIRIGSPHFLAGRLAADRKEERD